VTYLSIHLALRSLPTLRKILDPIKKRLPFISLVCLAIYLVITKFYRTNKRCKKCKDDPKVMAYPKTNGTKEKKFSHIKGLSLILRVYLNLKGS